MACPYNRNETKRQLAHGAVEALGEGQAVHGIDGVEEAGGADGFVALQVADQMPGGVQIGKLWLLGLPLLDAVFAEVADAGGVGFADSFDGERLRDSDEGDFLRLAPGARGGTSDAFADVVEIGGNGH